MSEIRFVVHLNVNEGKTAETKAAVEALVAAVRDNEDPSKTLQYDACFSEDGNTVMMMERYADAAAIGAHMENVGEALGAAMANTTVGSLSVVGDVPPPVKEALAAMSPTYYSVGFSGM
jgi:quinol monooxygenase YgiN